MEKRDVYVERFSKQLKDWNLKIDRLVAGADKAANGAKIEFSKQIELLKQKREDAAGKLQHLKDADADAWESIVEGTQKAWDDLKQAMHTASEKLKQ
jgi:hypothetical protein